MALTVDVSAKQSKIKIQVKYTTNYQRETFRKPPIFLPSGRPFLLLEKQV